MSTETARPIIPRPNDWNLPSKFIFALVSLSVTLLLMFIVVIAVTVNNELQQQIGERLTTQTTREGQRLGSILAEQVHLIQALLDSNPVVLEELHASNASYTGDEAAILEQLLALDTEWRDAPDAGNDLIDAVDNNAVADQLRLFIQQFPAHAEIFITDRYGAEIAGSGRTSDYYQADEDWWQAGWNDSAGAVFFSPPELDVSAGVVAIEITIPIRDEERETVIGIVKSVYDITALVADVSSFTFGETGRSQLISNDGYYIAGLTINDVGAPVSEALVLDGEIFAGTGFKLDGTSITGAEAIVGYAPMTTNGIIPEVDALGWIVRVEQARSEAFAPILQLQNFSILFLVFSIILATVVAIIMSRILTRGLANLIQASVKLGAGDLQARAAVSNQDEIGQLARSFNTMASSIEKREAELQELNRSLEKRVEERTQALQEALQDVQEANRLKDEFVAIMSHELRTPLNAIIGFQGILLMQGQLDEQTAHMVKRTRANADRLLLLINDILDISRIESGRLQIVPTDLALRPYINNWVAQMEVLAAEKDINLNVTIAEDVPDTISIDEDAITKIVTNLMSNAIKFTEEGAVTLAVRKAGNELEIKVQDTGIGIPIHMQDVIFERFRQVDATSKRRYGGSGLGLAIVYNLCQALDGTIQLQSDIGKGSVFTVKLPLVKQAA